MLRSGTFPPRGHIHAGVIITVSHIGSQMVGKMTAKLHHIPKIKNSKDCRKTTVYGVQGQEQIFHVLKARNPTC